MRRSLRHLAADGAELGGYGLPHGHMALRMLIAESLAEQQIAVDAGPVLLTQGSSQALDLAARRLVKPGDAVLVDDPGYPNLMFMLRFLGARLIGVPRTPDGYDLAALEALLAEHRPKAFFTQPRLQSPTNSVAPLAQLYRVLQLAEAARRARWSRTTSTPTSTREPRPVAREPGPAEARGLRRQLLEDHLAEHARRLPVVAQPDLLDDLAQLKMVSGLTSSDLTERLAFGALTEGRWRKHLKSLRDRLAEAHGMVAQRLRELGFELFNEPKAGMYLWARHPDLPDSAELSRQAARRGHHARARASCSWSSRVRPAGCASTSRSATTSGCTASWRSRSAQQAQGVAA